MIKIYFTVIIIIFGINLDQKNNLSNNTKGVFKNNITLKFKLKGFYSEMKFTWSIKVFLQLYMIKTDR